SLSRSAYLQSSMDRPHILWLKWALPTTKAALFQGRRERSGSTTCRYSPKAANNGAIRSVLWDG
ncbi:MAG: hypothetical protein ACK4QP_23600, partial [Pseudorhizobium sp.]